MRRGLLIRQVAIAGIVAACVYGCIYFLRRWDLRWGASDQEVKAPLPGDDLIARPNLVATRAILIRARAGQVWPWIAQMGQGRGGLYSYDALENIVGCDIHSADRIVPELQNVKVGDQFRLHPKVALQVAVVEPERALVISSGVPIDTAAPPYNFTWAFTLWERPDRTTRLIVRERYAYTRWWTPLLAEPIEAISFLMSQKMLRGIRDRAERAAALHAPSTRSEREVSGSHSG
jgi:hypothetical protein